MIDKKRNRKINMLKLKQLMLIVDIKLNHMIIHPFINKQIILKLKVLQRAKEMNMIMKIKTKVKKIVMSNNNIMMKKMTKMKFELFNLNIK